MIRPGSTTSVDSSSKNAVSFSSARTTNRFPSQWASTTQSVRPKTAEPKTASLTIVADLAKNIFGVWQADSTAVPSPEPD